MGVGMPVVEVFCPDSRLSVAVAEFEEFGLSVTIAEVELSG